MTEPLFDRDFLKKLEYLNLIAKRLVFGRQQALRQSVKKGASIEFKDFRDYVHGDEPRTIDWAVYARLDQLVIKLYRQEQDLDLWVLLDASGSMDFGEPNKFDFARRVAAALAYIGMCNMDSAGVLPFSTELSDGRGGLRGKGRIFPLLEFLTNLHRQDQTDFARTARGFVARVRRPGLVVIISDFYGLQNAQRGIDQLRFFKHQIYIVQVASPWEVAPDIRGELRLVDSESAEHCDLVVSASLLRRYQKKFQEFRDDTRRYCMRYSLGYSLATTETPFDEFILAMLQRGGLVA
ncbi:MAG: DUF58 domain-containing protein [Planctomycetaceae bacterium]